MYSISLQLCQGLSISRSNGSITASTPHKAPRHLFHTPERAKAGGVVIRTSNPGAHNGPDSGNEYDAVAAPNTITTMENIAKTRALRHRGRAYTKSIMHVAAWACPIDQHTDVITAAPLSQSDVQRVVGTQTDCGPPTYGDRAMVLIVRYLSTPHVDYVWFPRSGWHAYTDVSSMWNISPRRDQLYTLDLFEWANGDTIRNDTPLPRAESSRDNLRPIYNVYALHQPPMFLRDTSPTPPQPHTTAKDDVIHR